MSYLKNGKNHINQNTKETFRGGSTTNDHNENKYFINI